MRDKVVVITGANSGIGKETAVALAAMGATTVLACRNRDRADAAADDVRRASASDDVHVLPLDLADLSSVEVCAAAVLARWDRLDVLVNNAGGVWSRRAVTAQGFEQTLGVNHIGHFYLTRLLLERLGTAEDGRVVNVASMGHHFAVAGMRWNDLQGERWYFGFEAYCRSKLANVLFTRELARRMEGTTVTANAVHPGPVASGFGLDGDLRGLSALGNQLARRFEISPAAGAVTQVHVASSPEVRGRSGEYYARSRPTRPSRQARSDVAASRLWTTTEELITEAGYTLP